MATDSVISPKFFEHEWTVALGNWQFGVCETHPDVIAFFKFHDTPCPKTSVHLGLTSIDTNLSAYQVLGLFVIATVLLVAGVSFVAGRGRSAKAS